MSILVAIGVVVLACFSLVLLVGAPYLPTLKPQINAALDLAELRPGDTLLELGCGDGAVLVAAARQGIHVVGYELNPLLVLLCKLRTWRYRKSVSVIWGDFWHKPWPEAQAIFVFLLPKYMSRLDKKVMQYKHKPVKLISFAFEIPDRDPANTSDGVFAYRYR
jgi:16S rRNA A1518/A1519 N6-dimethyltransferase RsmA/KsgA/DIM1 with predicted DNA glycosylase/AP lyase activity